MIRRQRAMYAINPNGLIRQSPMVHTYAPKCDGMTHKNHIVLNIWVKSQMFSSFNLVW